jgi:pimeloyl-ACP methyl ester carboxylesterase
VSPGSTSAAGAEAAVVDWRRVAIGVGVAAAGTVAGYVGERALLRNRVPAGEPDPALGLIAGEQQVLHGPDGTRILVESYGPEEPATPTAVLVHGFCLSGRSWHEQVEALQDRVRLVTYDQPGHSRSSAPRSGEYDLDLLADALATVIDEAAPSDGRLLLVGHSTGGMAALALARLDPGLFERRVGALLLLSTAAKLGGANVALTAALRGAARARAALERTPRIGRRFEGLARPSDLTFGIARSVGFVRTEDPRYIRFVEEEVLKTPLETIIGLSRVILDVDEEEVLETIDVPTVVVVGTEDRLTPIRHARRMAELNPDVEVVELEGTGHVVQMSAAETVNALIERLTSEVAGRPVEA